MERQNIKTLLDKRQPPEHTILAHMIVDFAFSDESWITHEEGDLSVGMCGTLQGWYPEYRFLKEINDILVHFCPDLLADRIRKAS